ncbi:hypothetical protein [Paracraurococcus ruber]|uniref:CsbD family protein n=1 Tax=Paracraurococcus ruber TaxID=77675 RepID=A0ABS1D718_9PROT|nr:hypothetical protein [Paracraurococcus ruber]MBK1661862.1 hypothetical protein [Paracraurococcus ruber]TDG18945.1 hypothetical protein E2C05_27855 [Paracraurococcus ruber]
MADGFLSGWRSSTRDIRDDAEEYGRRAGSRLRDLRDDAEDYGRRTGSRLRDRGEDARGELSRLWSQMEDLVERRVRPAASEAVDTARSYASSAGSYARDGRDMAYDVADQVRDLTRSRPLVAIGVAVAATWVIASMLRSKR